MMRSLLRPKLGPVPVIVLVGAAAVLVLVLRGRGSWGAPASRIMAGGSQSPSVGSTPPIGMSWGEGGHRPPQQQRGTAR